MFVLGNGHPDGVLVWNGVQVFIGNLQSTHNSSHCLTHTQTEMVMHVQKQEPDCSHTLSAGQPEGSWTC